LVDSSLERSGYTGSVIETLAEPGGKSFDLLLHTIGRLFLMGVDIAWKEMYRGAKRRRVPLPTYPFERQRYWIEPAASTGAPAREIASESRQDSPSISSHRRPDLSTPFEAPRSAIEKRIAAMWEELLGYAPIGVHDDFFALGGDSFLGLQLFARLQPELPAGVSLQGMSGDWTVARFAGLIANAGRAGSPLPESLPLAEKIFGSSPVVLLLAGGAEPPFFCVHPAGGTVLCYRDLARCMGQSRPFYGIQAPGLYGGEEPADIEQKAALYVDAIRSVQAHGPYLLGGYSYGGDVAFEIACQLAGGGEQVAMVALIDSHPPAAYRRSLGEDELKQAFPAIIASYFELDLTTLQPPRSAPADPLDRLAEALQSLYPQVDVSWVARFYTIWAGHHAALHRYKPRKVFPGALTYLKARSTAPHGIIRPDAVDQDAAWASLCEQRLQVRELDGDHFSIIRLPYVEHVAFALCRAIDLANAKNAIAQPTLI
jgi:thioesterase domain-containing protein